MKMKLRRGIILLIGIILSIQYSASARRIRDSSFQAELKLQSLIKNTTQQEPILTQENLFGDEKYAIRFVQFYDSRIILLGADVIGILKEDRSYANMILYSFCPVTEKEKYIIMHELLPQINGNRYEILRPFHLPTSPHVELLDKIKIDDLWFIEEEERETLLREKILDWLEALGFNDGIVYEPMCSSAKLLETISIEFPEALLYGSDESQTIVKYAQKLLRDVENITIFQRNLSGSLPNELQPHSVDVLIFQRLNGASKIFEKHLPLLHKGSVVIVTGIKDVALDSEFYRKNGFRILNMSAFDEEMQEINPQSAGFFQFYVLIYEGNE